jgi:CRP-like cAMP-binding protein
MTTPRPIDPRTLLSAIGLFEGFTARDLEGLLALTTIKRLKTGQVLCRKGDPGLQLYGVLTGRLRVLSEGDDGKEVILNFVSPGEVIGDIALIDTQPRSATVEAIEPSELVCLHRRDLLPFLHQNPKAAIQLAVGLARRVRELSNVVQDALLLAIPARLAKKLLALAQTYGKATPEGTRIELRLPQHQLGEMIGATRESVNKTLRGWVDEGAISVDRGYVTIKDSAALEAAVRLSVD